MESHINEQPTGAITARFVLNERAAGLIQEKTSLDEPPGRQGGEIKRYWNSLENLLKCVRFVSVFIQKKGKKSSFRKWVKSVFDA